MVHRALVLVAFLVLPFLSHAQAPPDGRSGRQEPGRAPAQGRQSQRAAIVTGRVIDAATGAPVRLAEIQAMSGEDIRMASTDDEGRFELRDLAARAWRISAAKSGYVTWHVGQQRPFEAPPSVTLSAGQRLTADIRITRGSVITGRVYDEYGDAVTSAHVDAWRARMSYGRRHLERIGDGDLTDDTGAFRLYGLAPGDYYVTASLRVAPLDSPIGTRYAPTYFPGTANVAEARRLSLELGAEVNADFQVLPVRNVRVSGVVLNSGGGPADAFLNLVSEASEMGVPLGFGGATRPDGSFTLPDVAPGAYTLNASLRDIAAGETTTIPIVVGNDDLTGVTIVTARGATLRGTFAPDDGVTRPLPRALSVSARGTRPNGTTTPGTISGNGFAIDDVEGPFLLEVEGLPEGWTVKSIDVNGVDATDGPVDLNGQRDSRARIVLTDRITEVGGSVTRASGQANGSGGTAPLSPMGDARIVVFAEDPARWAYRSRFVRTVTADAQGRYRITGLPPGERYAAIAVDYLEDEEGDDPEFLATMKELAARFTLEPGARITVDLPLVQR